MMVDDMHRTRREMLINLPPMSLRIQKAIDVVKLAIDEDTKQNYPEAYKYVLRGDDPSMIHPLTFTPSRSAGNIKMLSTTSCSP